ncbi:MAG: hypothetical protein ACI4TK_08410 [Agathobacter sp.]
MEAYKNLEDICRKACRITWMDEETDARVTSITENAVPHLHHKLGMPGEPTPGDFEKPGTLRMLFENYCLYCWNNVPDEFEKNYRSDILTVRHRYEVEAAKNEGESSDV